MSVNGLNKAGFDFSRLQGVKAGQAFDRPLAGGDFLSFLKERLADFKSQAMETLMTGNAGSGIAGIASLLGKGQATSSGTLDALLGNAGASRAAESGLSASPGAIPACSIRNRRIR
jgi:hypothetical protein